MIIDFRVRVPFRESENDPPVKTPSFMDQYNEQLQYEEKMNKPFPDLIKEMEESDIKFAVLHAEYEFGDMAEDLNKKASILVKQYPDKFVGVATVDPRKGMDAVRHVEYAVKELGLRGLSLQPCFLNMRPTEPIFYPLYAKCVELDIPVCFHTGINFSKTHSIDPDRPIHLDRIACDFPELKIVAAHAGWPWTGEMVAIARKHSNVYMEFGAMAPKYIAHPRAGWDPMFQFMNSLLQDQVLFGTDWPMMSFDRAGEEFSNVGLKDTVVEKLLYKNAAQLMKINI